MCCWMPPVVQHEAPELALPDGSFHALSRSLILPSSSRARRSSIMPQNACNSAEKGVCSDITALRIIALRRFWKDGFVVKND